jgi:hypothetical protein
MWNNYDLGKQNLMLVRMEFLLVDWTFNPWGCGGVRCATTRQFCTSHMYIVVVLYLYLVNILVNLFYTTVYLCWSNTLCIN